MDLVIIVGVFGLVHRVVFDLMDPYLDKNDHLFFDNFNLNFSKIWKKRGTYACGTIRKDCGMFPPEFHSNLECGQAKYLCLDNLLAVRWKDKQDVYCLSSIHGTKESLVNWRAGDAISKPEIVTKYNKYMKGVDGCDQYLASYTFSRKTIKCWKKIFV